MLITVTKNMNVTIFIYSTLFMCEQSVVFCAYDNICSSILVLLHPCLALLISHSELLSVIY